MEFKSSPLMQCFLTFFGFVHPCYRLLHFHSPYGEREATIDVTIITAYNVSNEFDFSTRPILLN